MQGSRIHPRCPFGNLTVLQRDAAILSVVEGDDSERHCMCIDLFMRAKELGSDSVAVQESKARERAIGRRTLGDRWG